MDHLLEYDSFFNENKSSNKKEDLLKGFQNHLAKGGHLDKKDKKDENPRQLSPEEKFEVKKKINDIIKGFDPNARYSDTAKRGEIQIDKERKLKYYFDKLDDKDQEHIRKWMKRKFDFEL